MGAADILLPPFSPAQQHRRRISLPLSPPASPTRHTHVGVRHSISGHLPLSPPATPTSVTYAPSTSSTPLNPSSSPAKILLAAFSRDPSSDLPLHQRQPSPSHLRSPSLVQFKSLRPIILTPSKAATLFLIIVAATYLAFFVPFLSPLHLFHRTPSPNLATPFANPDFPLPEAWYNSPYTPPLKVPHRLEREAAEHIFEHESAAMDADKVSLADAITRARKLLWQAPPQKQRKNRLREGSEEARGWSAEAAEREAVRVELGKKVVVQEREGEILGGTHGGQGRLPVSREAAKKMRQLLAMQRAKAGSSTTGGPRVAVVKEEARFSMAEGGRRKPLKRPVRRSVEGNEE